MKNSQKGFIVPLIIIGVLLLTILGVYWYLNTQYYFLSNSNGVENVASIAVSKNDVSICNKITLTPIFHQWSISAQGLRNVCIVQFAVVKQDASICTMVRGIDESLAYRCYVAVAYRSKDINVCKNIDNTQSFYYKMEFSECIIGVAEATKNSSYCSMISDVNYRNECPGSDYKIDTLGM